ncbi:hypothetical protein SUDANB32_03612 [Streptomyces sp. enrichment culture]
MGVARYESYKRDLELLVKDVGRGAYGRVEADVRAALNGQAASQLRRLVPRQVRRDDGAFFTSGSVLARVHDLLGRQIRDYGPQARYWDPTCGAGDLLLAASKHLDIQSSPIETAVSWGRKLLGTDIHLSFVEVARLRLVLSLLDRHQRAGYGARPVSVDDLPKLFKRIEVGDGLSGLRARARFSGQILLNPPYGGMQVDGSCSWASGLTSRAAIFTADSAPLPVGSGGLVAVLPDVLRSGSRYAAWREAVSSFLEIDDVVTHGLFDDHTDVDVFLLRGHRRRGSAVGHREWWSGVAVATPVQDFFEVRVGTVVDNRDPHDGAKVPYLTARDLGEYSELSKIERTRRFSGRLFKPPFVVLRRTSRPSQRRDSKRSGAVLVTGDEGVAVDNHLIVLKPLFGDREVCAEAVQDLNSEEVTKWLDERIRCRHLTVGVVRSLPLTRVRR